MCSFWRKLGLVIWVGFVSLMVVSFQPEVVDQGDQDDPDGRGSRDKWKAKCAEAKATLKKAKNRSQWLETSRDNWKARAAELEAELQSLREEQKAIAR